MFFVFRGGTCTPVFAHDGLNDVKDGWVLDYADPAEHLDTREFDRAPVDEEGPGG